MPKRRQIWHICRHVCMYVRKFISGAP